MSLSELLPDTALPDSARSGRLSHAYIIAGDKTGGLAASLAAAAVCSGTAPRPCGVCRDCVKAARGVHPDIHVTEAEPGRELVVDKARAMRQDAAVMPNEADRKAYIVKNADMMNKAAQNAMLKLLEEPPGGAVFILDTADPSTLLDTVRSRCTLLRAAPGADLRDDEAGVNGEAQELARAFITTLRNGASAHRGGALELCAFSFKLDRLDRAGLMAFLDESERRAVEELKLSQAGAGEQFSRCLRAVSRARDMARQNVSAGHVSGMLLAMLI